MREAIVEAQLSLLLLSITPLILAVQSKYLRPEVLFLLNLDRISTQLPPRLALGTFFGSRQNILEVSLATTDSLSTALALARQLLLLRRPGGDGIFGIYLTLKLA